MRHRLPVVLLALVLLPGTGAAVTAAAVPISISWGHTSAGETPFQVTVTATEGLAIDKATPVGVEASEALTSGVLRTHAGGGDVDGIELQVRPTRVLKPELRKPQKIWAALLDQSDGDTVRRLRQDPAFTVDSPLITVALDGDGVRGFSFSLAQVIVARAIWVPALDVYITTGTPAVPFAEHRKQLDRKGGQRILDVVAREPEASLASFTSRWADMGDPRNDSPSHVVALSWDSAIAKFGIDRTGGVSNDFGNPDHFGFAVDVAGYAWRGQRLDAGLPIVSTTVEKDGSRIEIEEFAYPLDGPPRGRRGDIAMVLLGKVKITNLTGESRTVDITLRHHRDVAPEADVPPAVQVRGRGLVVAAPGRIFYGVDGLGSARLTTSAEARSDKQDKVEVKRVRRRMNVAATLSLPAYGSREAVFRLPSAPVAAGDAAKLAAIDYDKARATTRKFWSAWLSRGAEFDVPEPAVNDLFRANLWHALRLPRRHGGDGAGIVIDLPYSNFAYDQTGTPWPVNQAVYVDYMLYDLRGHHDVSTEELLAIYRNNQKEDGRVGGYANWGVYTPSMLYAVAQQYLLTHDRARLERLLPATLRAMEYCLTQLRKAAALPEPARGLVRFPLNDLTGEGLWAFNQAYYYAGLALWGRVLAEIGHARAGECTTAANTLRADIARAFGRATTRSPLVELRDHSFSPYVPADVLTPRRLIEVWYPTDVDTGAVHLLRLEALPARGLLADALLHDHEDNLFLKGWGMANEPVYNQQATAYLLRDEPRAVVRAFYSMMACAFSHSVLEPVEHRWTWGQYFGPPSTDGAWFEQYRRMLVNERDDGSLLIGQATPRAWLGDGKTIRVARAPTWYGPITFTINSEAAKGRITATVKVADGPRPSALVVRLRHPTEARLRGVQIDGAAWTDFDADKEWVRIPSPHAGSYRIVATY